MGPFSESGKETILVQLSANVLDFILQVAAGFSVTSIDIDMDELIEFCKSACWYHPFIQPLDDTTIRKLKSYYTAIVNIYPEILDRRPKLPLADAIHVYIICSGPQIIQFMPEIFKYETSINLIQEYISFSSLGLSTEDCDLAIKYYISNNKQIKNKKLALLLLYITDENLLVECAKMIKNKQPVLEMLAKIKN